MRYPIEKKFLENILNKIATVPSNTEISIYFTGSYVDDKATSGSDIDFLVITPKECELMVIKHLKESFKGLIQEKIDCKVLIKEKWVDYLRDPKLYFFLFNQLQKGRLVCGSEVSLTLDPNRMNDYYDVIGREIQELRIYLHGNFVFEQTIVYMFGISKGLMNLFNLISPQNQITLRNIWGNQLKRYGSVWERHNVKGIIHFGTQEIMKGRKIKTSNDEIKRDYERLSNLYHQLTPMFRYWYKQKAIQV